MIPPVCNPKEKGAYDCGPAAALLTMVDKISLDELSLRLPGSCLLSGLAPALVRAVRRICLEGRDFQDGDRSGRHRAPALGADIVLHRTLLCSAICRQLGLSSLWQRWSQHHRIFVLTADLLRPYSFFKTLSNF